MIINQASLDGLFRNLRTEFQGAYSTTETSWQRIASRLPSTTSREDYRWFHRWPKMREWLTERVVRSLVAHGYNVANRKFESTIAVLRDHLEDDILGIYKMQANGSGVAAAEWPDILVWGALEKGESAKCHDGKPFFASDHPLEEGDDFSNIVKATLKADSLENARASLGKARTAIMTMRDEEGEPMGGRPDLLVVPPALEDTANILAMSDRLGGDDPNPYKGMEVEVVARLKSATKWYVFDTSKALLPLIFQERSAPKFSSLMNPNQSDSVFLRDEYLYGVRARGAAAYGLPQCAVLGKP